MSQRQAVTRVKARACALADRAGKSRILDELVELTGWHRDYARAALRDALLLKVLEPRKPRGPTYRPRIMAALVKCWGAEPDRSRGRSRPRLRSLPLPAAPATNASGDGPASDSMVSRW